VSRLRPQSAEFQCVMRISGHPDDRIRQLRKAAKLLLRACGVRIVGLQPIVGQEAAK
jgi:hypothetical protein